MCVGTYIIQRLNLLVVTFEHEQTKELSMRLMQKAFSSLTTLGDELEWAEKEFNWGSKLFAVMKLLSGGL